MAQRFCFQMGFRGRNIWGQVTPWRVRVRNNAKLAQVKTFSFIDHSSAEGITCLGVFLDLFFSGNWLHVAQHLLWPDVRSVGGFLSISTLSSEPPRGASDTLRQLFQTFIKLL